MNPQPLRITSTNDKRIEPYKLMTQAALLFERERVVVAEGAKVVRRILQSDLQIVSLFASERYYEQFSQELQAKLQRGELLPAQCYTADKTLMSEIVGYKLHEGVMALAQAPEQHNLYDTTRTIALPAVFLSGVVDSENVGAIVRNCVAFGIRSLIVDEETSSPYLRRAVRVSLGGIFGMTVYSSFDLRSDIHELKETRGVRIIAAETGSDAITLTSYHFPEEYILFFGSEGYGLRSEVLSVVDDIIQIPILANANTAFAVNSLNVAAATAVMLYHAQVLPQVLPSRGNSVSL